MHFKISLVCFYLSPCIRKKACITLSYKILSAQNGREPVFLTKTLKVTYFTRIRLMLAAWTCWMLHIIIVIWFPESRDEVAHDFHQFWVRRHGEYGNLLKLDLNVVCLARRRLSVSLKSTRDSRPLMFLPGSVILRLIFLVTNAARRSWYHSFLVDRDSKTRMKGYKSLKNAKELSKKVLDKYRGICYTKEQTFLHFMIVNRLVDWKFWQGRRSFLLTSVKVDHDVDVVDGCRGIVNQRGLPNSLKPSYVF